MPSNELWEISPRLLAAWEKQRETMIEHSRELIAHAERMARGQTSCRDPIPIAEQHTRNEVQIQRAKETEDAS